VTLSAETRRARPIVRSVLRALGGVLVAVWGAATVGFFAIKAIPGDPVDVMLGVQAQVSESVRDQIRADWGLNAPLIVQYFTYLGRLARGDLGTSYQLREPVAEVLASQLPSTVALAGLAIVVAVTLSLISAVVIQRPWARSLASATELVMVSSPTFWVGLMLITVFALRLGWFPVAGSGDVRALILPAITLALPLTGIISQVLRQGLDAAAGQPFVLTARARGLNHTQLITRHTLRHAAADSVTLTGYLVGSLVGGAVLIETVFGRAGIGRVALRAIIDRDLPVVLGVIVMTALVFAVINVLVDLSYQRLDPRQQRMGGAS
jgi:peptide/nickel transport system permease protein